MAETWVIEIKPINWADLSYFFYLQWGNRISRAWKMAYVSRFYDNNEITPNWLPRFLLIARMIREHFLDCELMDYACTFHPATKEYEELMDSVKYEEKIGIFKKRTSYSARELFWPLFEYFVSLLNVGYDFNMEVRTSYDFAEKVFETIEKGAGDTPERPEDTFKLYEEINSYLNGKTNFTGIVTLWYWLTEYAERRFWTMPILRRLEEKRNLAIKDVIFHEGRVTFELTNFFEFSKELFGNEKVSASFDRKNWDLKITGKPIVNFRPWTNKYLILKELFLRLPNEKIDFSELWEIIEWWMETDLKYDKKFSKRLYASIDDINKKILEQCWIEKFIQVKNCALHREI